MTALPLSFGSSLVVRNRHVSHLASRGFSLVELLLVLGVIAALAIAAFVVYPNVQAGNQANSERANIDTITACVKTLYGQTRRYQDLDNDIANQSRCIPATMNGGDYDAGVSLVNSWGGDVTLEGSVLAGGTHFDITFEDITDRACIKLAAAVAGNYEFVSINGTIVKDPEDIAGSGALSFDPGAVGPLCVATQNLILVTTR